MANKETRRAILNYIEKNSKANLGDLAIMLGTDEVTIANEIQDMEKEQIICGYHTLIDWDKAGSDMITALIEVRVHHREIRDLIRLQKESTISRK